jgi:hypothetical protein
MRHLRPANRILSPNPIPSRQILMAIHFAFHAAAYRGSVVPTEKLGLGSWALGPFWASCVSPTLKIVIMEAKTLSK